jgi:hypothetical protein
MNRYTCLAAVLLLVAGVAGEVYAQKLELYSDEDYQYFGAGAIGKSRSQRFSPTTSTPNSLSPSNTFTGVGMYVRIGISGESANVTLRLYEWNTDYSTTIAGPVLAGPDVFDISTTSPQWIEVTPSTPLAASGSYLLRCTVNGVTYVSSGFGIRRSNGNDGGPGNDAYNDADLKTDREYQIRLTLPPSTSVEQWELYE